MAYTAHSKCADRNDHAGSTPVAGIGGIQMTIETWIFIGIGISILLNIYIKA